MSDIYEIVSAVLGTPVNELCGSDDIKKDLGADSVDIVDILDRIELVFGIHIPDSEAPNLLTISDFENYINNRK